ncbi:MMPL family transporter [Actinomadura sp. CNU-125]|uniref:MMPL family transporter n=1 Tax=Actinomadura sp. CNU-125 TaxID=1904961 RepID=UPI000ABEF7D4|nr:MMPL family transporter [Actinomadura sp. CNU-125]
MLENILVQGDAPVRRAAVHDLVSTLRGHGTVHSPLDPGRADLVSADGRSALAVVEIAGPPRSVPAHYDAIVRGIDDVQKRHPGVRLAHAGDMSLSKAVDEGIQDDMKRAEYFSIPLTLVILLVVFGSLLTAGIPVLLAATTVAGTFGVLGIVGHWVPFNSAGSSIVLLIGIAVSIDYSLFYLRRQREELAAGRSVAEALRTASRTSGHVVAVSGLTVMLCVAGLLFTGLDNFKGLTAGTFIVVGLAVTASVTVLPAMLSVLGHRTRTRGRTTSRVWNAVALRVVRRPLLWGGAAALALIVMTLPAFGMRLQDAAVTDSLPRDVPVVDAALRMQEAFPGSPSPAQVVLWEKEPGALDAPAVRTAVESLHPTTTARSGDIVIARVPLAHFGRGEQANRALLELRHEVDALELDGVGHAVAGKTAVAYDFTQMIEDRAPLVYGFVLILAFLLLAVAFRSVAVPLISILLNLLSIGAAYGVLTWGFQDGHLGRALDFVPYGAITSWLPLFMFVILFGLSMDYHIFILSRIRERRTADATAAEAIVTGIGNGSGVVTSAATIMIARSASSPSCPPSSTR